MYPTIYIWDAFPDHPEDHNDLYTYFDGAGVLTATGHCALFVVDEQPHGRQTAALFRY